jgi:hypothetical protein
MIKIPIEFPAIDDGIREVDGAFQYQIDVTIGRLYAPFGDTPVIICGSPE